MHLYTFKDGYANHDPNNYVNILTYMCIIKNFQVYSIYNMSIFCKFTRDNLHLSATPHWFTQVHTHPYTRDNLHLSATPTLVHPSTYSPIYTCLYIESILLIAYIMVVICKWVFFHSTFISQCLYSLLHKSLFIGINKTKWTVKVTKNCWN